jgi:phosphoribulokinase
MSARHPIIAVTGSSGAGTTTVMGSFAHIFRRERLNAQIVDGESFKCEAGQTASDFGPDAYRLPELEQRFAGYAERGEPTSDLLFYEGLHGGYVGADIDIARHVDLLVGVVPIVNLEWIQRLQRDKATRGASPEAVVATMLRRMPDYVHHIVPQFSRTHVNFQRVPTVDTSNPFIAKDIPSADESMVIIRFADPKGIDFPYLLAMLHDSWMSRPNNIVVPGGKIGLAMQLIFTPMILRLMDVKRRAAL